MLLSCGKYLTLYSQRKGWQVFMQVFCGNQTNCIYSHFYTVRKYDCFVFNFIQHVSDYSTVTGSYYSRGPKDCYQEGHTSTGRRFSPQLSATVGACRLQSRWRTAHHLDWSGHSALDQSDPYRTLQTGGTATALERSKTYLFHCSFHCQRK